MATLLDNFNRANGGPPPSGNWTDLYGGLSVVSNACKGSAAGQPNISFWNSQMGPNVDVEVTIVTKGGANEYMELFGRMTTQNVGTVDGYSVRVEPQGGTDLVTIYRVDNGSFTVLGASINQEFANGDKVRLRIVGNLISVWRHDGSSWAELGNRTDANYTAAGYVGLGIAHTAGVCDDFCAETISDNITVTPSAATVKGARVNPTVVLGSITITPASAIALAGVIGPVVLSGSIVVNPAAAVARAVTVNPIVIGGGEINPLGEGDSPGFIAFMISNSFYQNLTAAGLGAGLNEPDADNSAEWETFLFG